MKANNICIILFAFLLFPLLLCGQGKSKAQLEKEKEDNLKKIQETNRILEETKTQKDATIGQLSAIQQKISAQQALINSIAREIQLMDEEIRETEEFIDALESDLRKLKEEYAAMIYVASKSYNYHNKLTFIFSSSSFNQLMMRIKYFKQYSQARTIQVEQIEKVKESLIRQKKKLDIKRAEKNKLLAEKTRETQNLNNLKAEQDQLVKVLSTKETQLKKELEERRKAIKKLEKLIVDLINAERERAVKEARDAAAKEAKASGKPKDKAAPAVTMTPEAALLSSSFAGNLSKLPWPVAHGNISHRFGKQPHPVLKGVFIENLGVDILTLKNEPVRAVFQGKVITVADVPGMNKVVMIQHGEYFTVYARLKSVSVKTGQEVKAKDIIGEVYTDKDDVSELQFQVWKNSEKLDPEKCLFMKK